MAATITAAGDAEWWERRRAAAVAIELTAREHQILALMAGGASNSAICVALHLSPRTVESHIRSIFIKLNLHRDATVDRRVLAVVAFLHAAEESAAA